MKPKFSKDDELVNDQVISIFRIFFSLLGVCGMQALCWNSKIFSRFLPFSRYEFSRELTIPFWQQISGRFRDFKGDFWNPNWDTLARHQEQLKEHVNSSFFVICIY